MPSLSIQGIPPRLSGVHKYPASLLQHLNTIANNVPSVWCSLLPRPPVGGHVRKQTRRQRHEKLPPCPTSGAASVGLGVHLRVLSTPPPAPSLRRPEPGRAKWSPRPQRWKHRRQHRPPRGHARPSPGHGRSRQRCRRVPVVARELSGPAGVDIVTPTAAGPCKTLVALPPVAFCRSSLNIWRDAKYVPIKLVDLP